MPAADSDMSGPEPTVSDRGNRASLMQLTVRGEADLLSNHTDMLVENAHLLDNRVQAGDCAATGERLQAMVAYLDPTRPRASILNALPHMNLPCLLYAGERDAAPGSGPWCR